MASRTTSKVSSTESTDMSGMHEDTDVLDRIPPEIDSANLRMSVQGMADSATLTARAERLIASGVVRLSEPFTDDVLLRFPPTSLFRCGFDGFLCDPQNEDEMVGVFRAALSPNDRYVPGSSDNIQIWKYVPHGDYRFATRTDLIAMTDDVFAAMLDDGLEACRRSVLRTAAEYPPKVS